MKKLGLVLIAVVAIVFAGCKHELKKEDVQKFVTDLTAQIKNGKIDEALKAAYTDDMKDDVKAKFKEALTGQEFKIVKIEGDQVTLEVSATAADGGQVTARTVVFKVIEVNGKIRLKELLSDKPVKAANETQENAGSIPPADTQADNTDNGEEELADAPGDPEMNN